MKIIKYKTKEEENIIERSIQCKDALYDSNLAAILKVAYNGEYEVEELEVAEEEEKPAAEERLEKLERAINKLLKFLG